MVITVDYAAHGLNRLVTDPSERCEGDIIATSERRHVDEKNGITWEPRVLSAVTGNMRAPRCVTSTESVTETWHALPNSIDPSNSHSWINPNTFDLHNVYTLVTADQLKGAVSITIDGVLSYARDERGALASIGESPEYQSGELTTEKLLSHGMEAYGPDYDQMEL